MLPPGCSGYKIGLGTSDQPPKHLSSRMPRVENLSIPAPMRHLPVALIDNPDPHGRVAMMLCESLLHVLVEQGVISLEKAIEAIDGVAELMHEAAERDSCTITDSAALVLVETIRESFAAKDRAGPTRAVPAVNPLLRTSPRSFR